MGSTLQTRTYLEMPASSDLDHIPGDYGWPLIGRTYALAKDLPGLLAEHMDRYGSISRVGFNFQRGLLVLHPDQFQEIFLDRDKNFSNTMGYSTSIGNFYNGALLTQDFDIHMVQRRIFQRSFTIDSLQGYIEMMNPIVQGSIEEWDQISDLRFLRKIRQMLLDIGARVFFGLEDLRGPEAAKMHRAFFDIAQKGLMALFKYDVPGLKFHAGLRGKRYLAEYYRTLIPTRRENPGRDLCSMLATERDEDGNYWPDDLLIPQLSLLQFAAHDTTTGAVSHAMMYLAKPENQGLQEQLREVSLGYDSDYLDIKQLRKLHGLEGALQEALRFHPSVSLMPRRTVRECELGGYRVPPHTMLYLAPHWAHTSENWWTDPLSFDPGRFSEARQEQRNHRFVYVPFGGGAHKCIGMHFALLAGKIVMHQLLRRYRFSLQEGYDCKCDMIPMPAPTKELPMVAERL
jgi:cytochrome P450